MIPTSVMHIGITHLLQNTLRNARASAAATVQVDFRIFTGCHISNALCNLCMGYVFGCRQMPSSILLRCANVYPDSLIGNAFIGQAPNATRCCAMPFLLYCTPLHADQTTITSRQQTAPSNAIRSRYSGCFCFMNSVPVVSGCGNQRASYSSPASLNAACSSNPISPPISVPFRRIYCKSLPTANSSSCTR